jgi:PAS domain S-box-containing protein
MPRWPRCILRACFPRFARRVRGLRSRLVLLVLATLLPLGIFAVTLLLLFAHEARRTTERGMRDTARALALAMDREVDEVRAALGVLALSGSLAAGERASFYQQCLEALQMLPPDAWLTFSDRHGQLLFNTRVPYGTPLPRKAASDVVQDVVATGRPSQSDLVVDAVTHQPVVSLDVPVIRDGQVEAVLSLTRPAVTLGRLFGEQRLPREWIAALNDRQHRIVARSHEPERFIGTPATPRMAERSAATTEGWFPNVSQEGTLIYAAFSRVRSTGWTMLLFAPAEVVDAPGRRFLWLLISGGLVLSAVGVGWALWLGRRIAVPIQGLVPATQALAQGLPVPPAPAGAVQEVQDVAVALHAAAALLQQREAALYEQRERLHITLASIGDAVIATDSQGRVTFLNAVAAALTGWTEAEALGQDITVVFTLVNEATRQVVENPVTRVLRQGTVVGLANHTILLARNGVERPIDDSGAPIRDAQGRLVGVVLVFRDITARRQGEAERTQREAAHRFLAEASALLSTSLEVTTQLEHLARLLVPTLGDWCSIDLLRDDGYIHRVAVVHADPAKAALAEQLCQQYPLLATEAPHTLARVLRTGQSWFDPVASPARLRPEARNVAHWELIQALGFVAEIVVPLLARGKVLGTITCVLGEGTRRYRAADLALAEDLAHRAALALDNAHLYQEARAAQAALQQANATLEQRVAERAAALEEAHADLRRQMAERQHMQEALFQQEKLAALGTLLANVAHELNNPLAVATMQLDTLHEEVGSGAWTEDLELLRQAVERCQSVVQNFLALARQEPPTRSAVALHMIIDAVLVLLERALEADGIAVERHVADDLPLLWADAHQLHHLVANLITNAHYALRQTASPRHLRLTAAATADRSQVRLEVADSGPGIPEDIQRRVFEPFFTTKPQGAGSGLGLPLCRSIAEGHGGIIEIVSEPGHGTTVSVSLPVAAPTLQFPQAPLKPVEPTQMQRGTILLIDDEPSMQQALRRLLQRNGHDITTAANGQEGLAALETRSYEVILCDMRMPDLDGPGFYRELERRHAHLVSRVIFLTGDVLSPEAQAFFAQVNCPRLEKPFKAQEVRRVIQEVLASQ